MRRVGLVTAARSDYGIYRPVIHRIKADPGLDLQLFVTGMHLSEEFGMTVDEIERDGHVIADRVPMLLSSDSPEGIAESMGLGTIGFARSFGRSRPDILVVLGDRFEMMSAVTAAMPFAMPVAHIHGGESTEGLIDEAIRHSITKMSHLHFTSTEAYRDRVVQMGEEPWRVTVSGAPGLDNLNEFSPLDKKKLEDLLGLTLDKAPLLVTFHPVTLEYEDTEYHITQLLEALDQLKMPVVFTFPNADTSGRVIIRAVEQYTIRRDDAVVLPSLGTRVYFSLMGHAFAMVGNSSSGIIEAASFGLPVVNIGSRQAGRHRGANVMDSGYETGSILKAVARATDETFRKNIAGMVNPYGDGRASERIVKVLKSVDLGRELVMKKFHDIERP